MVTQHLCQLLHFEVATQMLKIKEDINDKVVSVRLESLIAVRQALTAFRLSSFQRHGADKHVTWQVKLKKQVQGHDLKKSMTVCLLPMDCNGTNSHHQLPGMMTLSVRYDGVSIMHSKVQ